MHRTPYQTLLAERLQSAKGLGWDFETTGKASVSPIRQMMRFVPHRILRYWFRFAR